MVLELAHNISVIWPNQIQRNVHARVYTNKTCRVKNQWNWGWVGVPAPSSRLHSLEYLGRWGGTLKGTILYL